ncbi:MAG: adenine deaminase [Proteobacteria bacterium]|nr:adenine deaminase [Pseudomonadota bacterium]
MQDDLATVIRQGRGTEPADLVLKGGQVFCLVTGEMILGDVTICGQTIAGIGATYDDRREIDATGLTLVPGFIDTYLHIESSLVTPQEFDRCVCPRGVTTAICDPHEIANVAGADGIRYFLDAAKATVIDIQVQLSSCVASTEMETAGARLDAADLLALACDPKVIGLAEFMNYPGVLHADPGCLAKLEAFRGRHIDGHAPLLSGRDLNGCVAAGIRTEHESTHAAEAVEKLQRGLRILIRAGSVSKDIRALAGVLTEVTAPYIALCTDDRNPLDIAEHGHIDHIVRSMIKMGRPMLAVYPAASLSAAEAFGLKDRGQIAPGKRADILALPDLAVARPVLVIAGGRVVDDAAFAARPVMAPIARQSVKAPRVTADSFRCPGNRAETPFIGILPGKIITEHRVETIAPQDGDKRPDPGRDLLRIAVIERHRKNGNIAAGFAQGFGLQRGAIASTVCHDHHNIAVVGADYADMALAANRLTEIEGGFVVAKAGRVTAELALPLAGLMSLHPFEAVEHDLRALRAAARALAVTLEGPFLQLAFLALPVLPNLKMTDRGMVDVDRFEILG